MSCVLCNTYFLKDCPQFDIFYIHTSHSNTLLLNFIKKILNWDLNGDSHSRFLCQHCYNLLQDLDYAEVTCARLKKQLSERSITNRYSNYFKDNSTQTTDDVEDKFDDFSETFLESLKSESSVIKSPEPEQTESKTELTVEKKAKPYECNLCQKRFASKSGLNLHSHRQHPSENIAKPVTENTSTENQIKLECDVVINECLKSEPDQSDSPSLDDIVSSSSSSTTRSKVKRTKKSNFSSIKPLKYTCPQCPKMWRTLGELRSHVATHSTLRPYICEVCGQAYKHKQALDIHVGMHNGINPFSCPYCNKAFTQKGALQRHLPIHTGEAPYQCDLCGKRFVHHTSFNMHTLAHTGQKSYKCNTCGLALLSGSHLKRHMRVHTGERPYACSQCGKRFAERYNLAAHQRLHEAGPSELSRRLHRCQVCGAGFDRRPKLEEHLSNNHNKIAENDQTRKWVGHFLGNT